MSAPEHVPAVPEEPAAANPAEQTAAELAAAFPGLRQAHPYAVGRALVDVQLEPNGTARYAWAGYDVHVTVGHEDHADRDPDSTALHRQIRAHATLLVQEIFHTTPRGHVEWDMTNPRPELVFPAAYTVATADRSDPRFASAVLVTVAMALDYARLATEQASRQALLAADEVRWESERPPGVSQRKWLREKRAQRDAAR
ncbi:hypothetical protein [Streptomyces chartreusis]|uniref:Uncharacterized protein n=1 Tax=Streptomyces chartreusis TaxID=1969 RepID=A0A7H8T9Z2_STRCX|nr:hypothetical protein [Streptomyces chartreusis]QKZ20301.1 hypothetical protein HUT05_24885 [Streptomyces chartreusis]